MLIGWHGLAEGHKVIKHVVYGYRGRPEVEYNFSTFHLSSASIGGSESPTREVAMVSGGGETLGYQRQEKQGLENIKRGVYYFIVL